VIKNHFYILSGETKTIAAAECLAILESLNMDYKAEKYDQVLLLKAEEESCQRIAERAAMVHRCCISLLKCEADFNQIMASLRDVDFQKHVSAKETFAVRVKRIKNYSPELSSLLLEKEIGALIHRRVGARANLENPDKLFYGVLTEDIFLFGISVRESERKALGLRKAKFRPFFIPSSMNPHLARAMVNLSRARPKGVFLDPFCGAGGLLIEAGLMGCKTIGSDIDKKMVKGAKRNLLHFNIVNWNIILSDAKHLPLNRFDSIATDPPYGGSASTKGVRPEKLIEFFLQELDELSSPTGYICLGTPLTVNVDESILGTSFRIIEKHLIRVHKSLTRQIIVLRK
jgi:tRNA (guanine10-N2)-dimethyltransferase